MGMVKVFIPLVIGLLLGALALVSGQVGSGPRVVSVDPVLTRVRLVDGTAAAPSRTYASDTDLGSYRIGANNEGFTAGGVLRWDYNTTRISSTIPFVAALHATGLEATDVGFRLSGGDFQVVRGDQGALMPLRALGITSTSYVRFDTTFETSIAILMSNTAPTVSGFGTTPSVPTNNGTAAFTINVGTGGTASTGTITLPAATTGWVVMCQDVTTPTNGITKQTGGSTTTATLTNYDWAGAAVAWAASDILRCMAIAY